MERSTSGQRVAEALAHTDVHEGATVGTLPDDGYSTLVKALLLVVVPGPIIMLDGQANLLRDRREAGGLKDSGPQPLFRSLAVFDGRAGDLKLGIAAQLAYRPGAGDLITVSGNAEAYYHFQHPDRWHLWLGIKPAPLRERILESVLGADADAYWTIDYTSMQTGATLGLEKTWDFSVTVFGKKVGASIEAAGRVWFAALLNWKPTQASGELGASVDVVARAFGRQVVRLMLDGLAQAEAPKPFWVDVELSATVDLPWPFPDPEITIHFSWKRPEAPPVPVLLAAAEAVRDVSPDRRALAADVTYDADGDGFHDSAATPAAVSASQQPQTNELDARPRLTFTRPVTDLAGFGGESRPAEDDARPYSLDYRLKEVTFEKLGPQGQRTAVNGFTARWKKPPGVDGAQMLEVWGTTPYSLGANAADGGLSQFQDLKDRDAREPCGPQARMLWLTFEDEAIGQSWPSSFEREGARFLYHYIAPVRGTPRGS